MSLLMFILNWIFYSIYFIKINIWCIYVAFLVLWWFSVCGVFIQPFTYVACVRYIYLALFLALRQVYWYIYFALNLVLRQVYWYVYFAFRWDLLMGVNIYSIIFGVCDVFIFSFNSSVLVNYFVSGVLMF